MNKHIIPRFPDIKNFHLSAGSSTMFRENIGIPRYMYESHVWNYVWKPSPIQSLAAHSENARSRSTSTMRSGVWFNTRDQPIDTRHCPSFLHETLMIPTARSCATGPVLQDCVLYYRTDSLMAVVLHVTDSLMAVVQDDSLLKLLLFRNYYWRAFVFIN